MAEAHRRLRPPPRRPRLDSDGSGGFFLSFLGGLLPLPEPSTAFRKLMSATADAFGMRDGIVLLDSTGAALGLAQQTSAIIPGEREDVIDRLSGRAAHLGYVRREVRPRHGIRPRDVLNFELSWVLPELDIRIHDAGDPVPLRMVDPFKVGTWFIVPQGACGISVTMAVGRLSSDPGQGPVRWPTGAALDHLSRVGVEITPPTRHELRWRWWWHREAVRRRLAHTARDLGPHRRRIIGVQHIGIAGTGPYTYAVAAVQPGDPEEIKARILRKATSMGIRVHGIGAPRLTTADRDDPALAVVTYRPGEHLATNRATLLRDERPTMVTVPAGHAGVLLGLTCAAAAHQAPADADADADAAD